MPSSPDVVVVGAGPAGSAAAYWLARYGHSVTVIEKKGFPREKTCGDGLTPRSIYQLSEMGFDFDVGGFHKVTGLRSYAGDDLMIELAWPEHSKYPNWGGVIRRMDLDGRVATLAEKQGAVVRQRTEASPLIEAGHLAGVNLSSNGDRETLTPKAVVIADGSMTRFGRAMGTHRRRDYPMGLAARGYFSSPRSDDGFMESQLDIRDSNGNSMPGYGWVFPLGDGTVNVGVGLLSTFRQWKSVNTSDMMAAYVDSAPGYWGLSHATALSEPRGGKLSMALSVGPYAGSNWVLVGDAVGAINPWNGEGIAYAYETGRMAADHIHQALASDDLSLLRRYSQDLEDTYGLYYRMARIFVKAIGYPQVMWTLAHVGLRSRPLMEWVLKVMSNLLEAEDRHIGERAYAMLERIVRVVP
ncbi:MAG: geranylgeranyl reductase family protein [Acidimicrobiia bacterium]|nr:geranylgeranyl reductase family protein [Acidimicrobiia bacterium]MDH3397315.1 geranylgeranyl reductase family protein [Acidimicrobiia bacterium]